MTVFQLDPSESHFTWYRSNMTKHDIPRIHKYNTQWLIICASVCERTPHRTYQAHDYIEKGINRITIYESGSGLLIHTHTTHTRPVGTETDARRLRMESAQKPFSNRKDKSEEKYTK